jgi:hypothetical protein
METWRRWQHVEPGSVVAEWRLRCIKVVAPAHRRVIAHATVVLLHAYGNDGASAHGRRRMITRGGFDANTT